MINQVAFVFREVLGAYILDLLQLLVVFLIDAVVVGIDLFGGHLHEVLQVVDLGLLLVQRFFFQSSDLLLQSKLRFVVLQIVLVAVVLLELIEVINPDR